MGIHLYDVLSLGNAVDTHIQKTSYDNAKKKYDAFCEYQYRIHVLSFQMVMIKCLNTCYVGIIPVSTSHHLAEMDTILSW